MASRGCKSSGAITSDAAVTTTPCLVWAISLKEGSDASSISIRDGGATGTIKWVVDGKSTAAGDKTGSIAFAKPLSIVTSLYADIAGTDAAAFILYEDINS